MESYALLGGSSSGSINAGNCAARGRDRLRANRAKLAVDLYDRRFALFMEVRHMVSEAVAHARVIDGGLPNEVLAQGRYLFGPEIQKDL
jgi:hypothetical protein